jgi:hypothetical protein
VEDQSRKDIRRILKTFGIQADERLVAHLARNPELSTIQVRITLDDVTEYPDTLEVEPVSLVIEDAIRR